MSEHVIAENGMEASFVESWEGWDEMDTSDLYFYDVKLLPGIFPAHVYEREAEVKASGGKIDLGIWGQTSVIELYDGNEEPIFKSQFKLVLVEEV